MEHRDWGRIQEIYNSARELHPAERNAFVARECHDNPSLANEVNELLSAEESSAGFLESPVFEMGLKIISTAEDIDDDLVRQTINDRYVVIKKLQTGGMGKVFLARDLQLSNRLVIIKVLLDVWFKDPDAVERFKREVHALTLIDQHPNVVSVYDAGELPNGKPYVVMQYIDGTTLRNEIPTLGMDPNRAASILKQIGTALDHIHAKGILHRDLKPENIMLQVLDSTEWVKIVDFGIAKIKDSVVPATDTNIRIGTAAYMSPEQMRGEKLTPASDVYAMAVIAHEMLTGNRPENSKVAPVRRGLTVKAKDIIRRGLLAKPADRYQSAKRFGDDLHTALIKPQPSFTWLKVIAAVLVVSLLSFGIYEYRDELFKDNRNKQTVLPSRKGFDYWLMVQKMRDGKPYKDPTKANGATPLDTDDQFQLNVLSQESGYLYIFHERPPEADNVSFKMIYPKKGTNDASATIGANQTFQSDWITLKPPAGSENFWIVWSVSPVNELESAKNQALTHPQAGLTNQNLISVKEFLKTMQTKTDVSVRRYEATQAATVRANSDLVLALVEFKHR